MHISAEPMSYLFFAVAILMKIILPLLILVGVVVLVIFLVKRSSSSAPDQGLVWQRLNALEMRVAELERRLR